MKRITEAAIVSSFALFFAGACAVLIAPSSIISHIVMASGFFVVIGGSVLYSAALEDK